MNVSYVIQGLLDKVRTETLSHFTVLDSYIYDENLDFRGRASQWLAREGIFQKYEGEIPNDWVFIIWNRSSIQNSNYNNRPMQMKVATPNSPDGKADAISTYRSASINVGFKIVTNNMNIAETIEEHLYVNTGELTTFAASYEVFGVDVECSASPDTTTTFEKEDLNELGPVIGVGVDIVVEFPVIMPVDPIHRINIINEKIWGYPLNEPKLMHEEVID